MINLNNTSLYDEFYIFIKADIELLRKECKSTRDSDAFLMNYISGVLSKSFEKTTKNTNNSSAIPLS